MSWLLTLLFALAAVPHQHTIRDLSSTEFRVRHAASQRLAAEGWLAYPALATEQASPEAADRCEALIARLPRSLTTLVLRCDAPTDEQLLLARRWLAAEVDRRGESLRVETCDGNGARVYPGTAVQWITQPPFICDGSEAGEVRAVWEALRK